MWMLKRPLPACGPLRTPNCSKTSVWKERAKTPGWELLQTKLAPTCIAPPPPLRSPPPFSWSHQTITQADGCRWMLWQTFPEFAKVVFSCALHPPSPVLTPLSPWCGSVSSHCTPSPPCRYAHGFNVFITCLTRCLIASPLNGAVTVVTRNKRPPENEMIKQVTLAKQTALLKADARLMLGGGGRRGLEATPSIRHFRAY